jgi:hypothetical protein
VAAAADATSKDLTYRPAFPRSQDLPAGRMIDLILYGHGEFTAHRGLFFKCARALIVVGILKE